MKLHIMMQISAKNMALIFFFNIYYIVQLRFLSMKDEKIDRFIASVLKKKLFLWLFVVVYSFCWNFWDR